MDPINTIVETRTNSGRRMNSSNKYEIEDDCYIYEVILETNLTHYVSFGRIHDIIGDEEWLQGEGNCLCNIASS